MQERHILHSSAITRLIVAKIADGLLPNIRVRTLWAGPGTGRRCAGCDAPIDATEIEDEIELAAAVILRLHQRCFNVWQRELAMRDGDGPA